MRLAIFLLSWLFLGSLAQAVVVDRLVAVVNNEVITLSELDEAATPLYQRLLPQVQDPIKREALIREIRKRVLNQLIDEHLVSQEVKRLHITVTDEEVDHFINELKKQQGISDQEFINYLTSQGLSLEDYRKKIAEQIKRLKLIQSQVKERIVVTDEEIRKYYEEHYAKDVKYELAAIIIDGPGAEEKVKKAMEALKAGEPFAQVAARYSSLPDSGQGLGAFSLDELSPQVAQIVKNLKPGEISQPVKVGGRWQIFKLLAIKQDRQDFNLVKLKIQRKLYQEKVDQLFKKWLKDLRKRSYIRILL